MLGRCSVRQTRILVVPAGDRRACKIHFDNGVYQIPFADVGQRRWEEIALARRRNVRKDNDKSGMEFFLSVERSEIRAVVRNKRVILSADPSHQLPIFVPAKPEEVHVFTHMTGIVRHRNE